MMEGSYVEDNDLFDWKLLFLPFILIAIRWYFKGTQFRERVSAKNLVAAVTGCNCGIGKQIVRELNLRGAKVYMLCRKAEFGDRARVELVKLGCNPERLKVKEVDLSNFITIRKATEEIKKEEDHLDILINNAAVKFFPKFRLTDDGHEYVWQTNYLGHFLLTELLLPLLCAAPSARVVNVSDSAHHHSDSLDLHLIDRREYWDARQSYAKSKLAMVMHAVDLTRRLRATNASNVTVNSCHPGYCYTRLMRYTPLDRKPLNYITAPFRWYFLKTPKDGAQTPLYVALSKKVSGASGLYYSECSVKEPLAVVDWEKKYVELGEYSLKICELDDVAFTQ